MTTPFLEAPESVLSTMDSSGKRKWIYPTESRGKFWRGRLILGWMLIALFISLPWIQINGKPAVFLNVLQREFTFFGLTLHPTDSIILMVFGLTVLISVFFFTALFGRVWCGWACPQTVYLEFVFRPIERLIEGKETKRRRRDQKPMDYDKAWRKVLKFAVFFLISAALAHTFVAYFAGWHNLLRFMGQSPAEAPGYFLTMLLTTGLVLFDFGYFREQMCTITCPYARFQSVLMDENSLIVSYDPNRGENRGTARARRLAEQHDAGPLSLENGTLTFGDCVDCFACVRTCPVGIDIRDGLQMECVSCTQCIDACNDVMDAVGRPRGLIRYTSENAINKKPTRVLRPRLIAYGIILLGLSTVLTGLILTRSPLEVDVARARGTTYTMTADGDVANRLRFRLRNRTGEDATLSIRPAIPANARVQVVGEQDIHLEPGALHRVEAWITVPAEEMPPGGVESILELVADGDVLETVEIRLLGPGVNGNGNGNHTTSK